MAILVPLLYCGFFRWAFTTDFFQQAGGLVSLSFIASVPFGLGGVSVAIGRWRGSSDFKAYGVRYPGAALALGLLFCMVLKIEAAICVIMAAPILFGASLLGSAVAHRLLPGKSRGDRLFVSLPVLIPRFAAQVEQAFEWPSEVVAIHNSIDIQSTPGEVWGRIASVEEIPASQLSNRWIYWVGFPRPVSALLSREGVGGIRTATFERDVSFFEVITEWDYPRRLAFSIHADPDFIPHTAFDRHIIVGGRFYDVLDGIYSLEELPGNVCRLHLTSHHRLSTRFNAYAHWWSRQIMDQIQSSILEVIKKRAETRL